MAAIHHSQALHFIRQLAAINLAIAAGLSNTNVADSNTVEALATAVEALSVHKTHVNKMKELAKNIRISGEAGINTNALQAALTTTAGLQALYTSALPNYLTSTTVGKQAAHLGS